jgi:hypothetical protein
MKVCKKRSCDWPSLLYFMMTHKNSPFSNHSPRQQETTAFGRGGMRHRVAGMSPHMSVGQEAMDFARGTPL